jgi:hypothetical protein
LILLFKQKNYPNFMVIALINVKILIIFQI